MAKHTPSLQRQAEELGSVIKAVEWQLDEMLKGLAHVQQQNPTLAQHFLLEMMKLAEGRDHLRDALDTIHAIRLSKEAEARGTTPSGRISKMQALQGDIFEYCTTKELFPSNIYTEEIMAVVIARLG